MFKKQLKQELMRYEKRNNFYRYQERFDEIPTNLYKYRSINYFGLKGLLEDELRLTAPKDLNDPYECAFSMDFMDKLSKILKELEKKLKIELLSELNNLYESEDVIAGIEKLIQEKKPDKLHKTTLNKVLDDSNFRNKYQNKVEILALTRLNNSILMWSHYGDYHKGMCLEIPNEALDKNKIYPVFYDKKLHLNTRKINGETSKIILSSLVKFEKWNYEEEWRVVDINIGKNSQDRGGSNLKLKKSFNAIYLGFNVSKEDEELIKYIALKKDIKKVYKLKRNNIRYELIIEEVQLQKNSVSSLEKIKEIFRKKFLKKEADELIELISNL